MCVRKDLLEHSLQAETCRRNVEHNKLLLKHMHTSLVCIDPTSNSNKHLKETKGGEFLW
jgi:hypothetical protein